MIYRDLSAELGARDAALLIALRCHMQQYLVIQSAYIMIVIG